MTNVSKCDLILDLGFIENKNLFNGLKLDLHAYLNTILAPCSVFHSTSLANQRAGEAVDPAGRRLLR